MILIVEDDRDLADTCAMLLEACGYRVVIAANGADALKKIVRCMPDLIVSDCHMPRMGGTEMCAKIREMEYGTMVPIVLISGTDECRYLNSAKYNAFLKKPFSADQFLLTIRALLNPVNTHAGRWGQSSSSLH